MEVKLGVKMEVKEVREVREVREVIASLVHSDRS
jgi:hypothetical protein